MRPVCWTFLFAALLLGQTAHAAEPLNVVATLTLYGDLARQVGADKVRVETIVPPRANAHFYEPKPSDVRKVSKAGLYIHSGAGLEAWSDPLLEKAGKPGLLPGGAGNLGLSEGIRFLDVPRELSRSAGDIHASGNPHYHMDPRNARTMIGLIRDKLKELDPGNAAFYESNSAAVLERLDRKIADWKELCAACAGKEIISFHRDIQYFADFLGMKAEQTLEPKPGIQPTPKHLLFLEEYARSRGVKAVALPTYYPKEAADALASKVGAKVITLCQNAGELPGTEDLFGFFDSNVRAVSGAV